jgi:hypothetical protein
MAEPKTWRDNFAVEQPSFETDCEESVPSSPMPFHCGASHPREWGKHCGRPAGHVGDHMVVHFRYGPDPECRWPREYDR